MSIPQQQDSVTWTYDLRRVSQDRRSVRTSVEPGGVYRLIGHDGRQDGGLTPFPGFERYDTLTATLESSSTSVDPQGSNTDPRGSGEQESLVDFFPVTLNIGSDSYAWGFVYRLTTEEGNSRIFMRYRRYGQPAWQGPVDLVGWKTSGLLQMDVKEFGRFVYVGVAGDFLARVSFTSTGTLEVTTDTGPGEAPSFTLGPYGGVQAEDDVATAFALLDVPTDDRPAAAKLVYCGFSGKSGAASGREYADTGPDTGVAIAGPSDLGLWTAGQEPQADPSFEVRREVYPDGSTRTLTSGGKWLEDEQEPGDPVGLVKGTYSFAYTLFDTRTGLESQPSPIVGGTPSDEYAYNASIGGSRRQSQYRQANVPAGIVDGEQTYVNRGGYFASSFRDVTFPAIDIVYDSSKYDTLRLYRSSRFGGEVTDPRQFRNLSLENTVTLADYEASADFPSETDAKWKRAVYFCTLNDRQLSSQRAFFPEFSYEAEAPKSGALGFYRGSMFYGGLDAPNVDDGGQPTFRFSTTFKPSPELVSVFNRELLSVPSEDILTWHRVGSNLMGLSRYAVYAIRKEGATVRVYPQHEGYGVTGPRAAIAAGSMLYFLTDQGVKVLDETANLSDFPWFDDVIINEWADDLADVQFAFDSRLKLLMIHNPHKERTLCFWMNKQIVSELEDITFTRMTSGDLPIDPTIEEPEFARQAFGIMRQRTSFSNASAWQYDVYRMSTTFTGHTIDFQPIVGTTASYLEACSSPGTPAGAINVCGSNMPDMNLAGRYAYIMNGPYAGQKFKVDRVQVTAGISRLYPEDMTRFVSPTVSTGTWLMFGPPVVGVEMGVVGMKPADQEFHPQIPEVFRAKKIDGMALSFVDVDDQNGTAIPAAANTVETYIFEGNEAEASHASRVTKEAMVVDGASPLVSGFGEGGHGRSSETACPGLRIALSKVFYRLIGLRVRGSIRGGRASNRTPQEIE